MVLLARGEGMTTFGQRVKKAWKNINEIKPKNNDINQKKMKNKPTIEGLKYHKQYLLT
jgi:hypothetical protein